MTTTDEKEIIPHHELVGELARMKAAGQRVSRMKPVRGGYVLETEFEPQPELLPP